MKGIKLCAECANYDLKKHRCKIGCHSEENPKNPFYDDCPLPDVVEKKNGHWTEIKNPYGELEGWIHEDCGHMVKSKDRFCAGCGAWMYEVEQE